MLDYTLIKKNIKKIYLRIKNDEVIVSAPLYVSKEEVDRFVYKNLDWIKAHQKASCILDDGDVVRILEEEYTIHFSSSCNIDGNIIYCQKKDDQFKKLVLEYTKSYFYDRFYEISTKLNIHGYDLKIRYYSSKWGSCTPKKKLITLNGNLIFASLKCIDAIIYHELAHTKVFDHSKDFYSLLYTWMPNYKEIMKQLKQIQIPRVGETI